MASRRRTVVVLLLLLTVTLWGLSGVVEPGEKDAPDSGGVAKERLIRPAENGSALWPYTSSRKSVDERTLAINLIVHGSDENVRRTLTKRGELNFQPVETEPTNETESTNGTTPNSGAGSDTGGDSDTDSNNGTPSGTDAPTPNETLTPNDSDAVNDSDTDNESQVVEIKDTGIEWTDAHGAARYSYVDTAAGEGGGQWIEESYQLRSGPYLGSRLHIRAYASPTDDWTALQIHRDYWDWFRLRHTVPNTHEPTRKVESNFIGKPYVSDVSREYYGIEGGRSDGWLSVIELSSAAILLSRVPDVLAVTATVGLLGVVSTDTRLAAESTYRWLLRDAYRQRGGFLLAGVLAALVIGVRIGGITIETAFPGLHPKLIVAALYPVLAFGLPVVTSMEWFTGETEPSAAFGLVIVGVGAAFVLDFGIIGVSAVPIGLVLHRSGLLVSLGLIAAGTSLGGSSGRHLRLVGAGAWGIGLVLPLLSLL